MAKSRAWCFTLNNYVPDEERVLHELNCKYLICGREKGENETPHLQGYVYFHNARHLAGVKTILQRAHWEQARGSPDQNREYCIKQGDYFETGMIPMSQKRKGEVEIERWDDAWKAAKTGDIDSIPSDIKFRYYRTVKEIQKDYMEKPADLSEFSNVWVYGKPGVGKSRSVRILYPDAYMKSANKWWDGYQGEQTVIWDDFELDHAQKYHHELKTWSDLYSFIAEHKGGASHIRPKRLVITSNYSPAQCFAYDPIMLEAVVRRFEVQHVIVPIVFEPTPVPEPVESVIVSTVEPVELSQESVDFGVWDLDAFDV